ncbi:MAG TPA: (S)-ureidoglycine aminohydrolase [Chthoniobacterales bacterium]
MQAAQTRTVVKPHYALISPDGYVPSVLPGWTGGTSYVQISSAMGARVGQWLVELPKGATGTGETFGYELFLYVVSGAVVVQKQKVAQGGYAFLPPGTRYEIKGTAASSRVLIFRKRYEPLVGFEAPEFFTGHEASITEVPFLGDPQARLKTLIPDTLGADMAVNIFTYEPGATLPFVETHVMEHGMFFLTGGGVYRLGDNWHPVSAGDAIWIAPYCPQWFIAAGPGPARYIYYKDVNRTPL